MAAFALKTKASKNWFLEEKMTNTARLITYDKRRFELGQYIYVHSTFIIGSSLYHIYFTDIRDWQF